MLKKLFLASLMMLTMFSFSSCCDGDDMVANDNGNGGDATATADYTVILWSIPGGTDLMSSSDFIDILRYRQSGAIGDNVNIVGRIKSTNSQTFPSLQDKLKSYGYDGTVTFDIGKKIDAKLPEERYYDSCYNLITGSNFASEDEYRDKASELIAEGYKLFFDNTAGTKVGGMDYPFNCVDSLAAFIKNAAETHPAKNYVLIVDGHGNGFDFDRDFTTRATLVDDATDKRGISIQGIADAVKMSGVHLQSMVCHSCEMGALENMPYFQQAADYVFMSSEVTTGFYMKDILAYISKAGGNTERMKEAGHRIVDSYVVTAPMPVGGAKITSLGFYDMSKTQDLMAVVKRASSWYSDAADKAPEFIGNVVNNSICSQELEGESLEMRDSLLSHLYDSPANMTQEVKRNYVKKIADLTSMTVSAGFILSHVMYQTLNMRSQTTAALDFNALQVILDDYVQALKNMAYIKATKEDSSINDYSYIFTSPSIRIAPFNSLYNKQSAWIEMIQKYNQNDTAEFDAFINTLTNAVTDEEKFEKLLYDNCAAYANPTPYAQLLQNYQALLFDQQTGWSNFLQKINFIPTYATVPTRILTMNQQ